MALDARASYLRRTVARRRSAPVELLQLVQRLRRAEETLQARVRECTVHTRENSAAFARLRQLRGYRWRAYRRMRELKRALGMFASPEIPLPALAVAQL